MKFLGVGETNDLGAMYLALMAEGHEVRVVITDPAGADTLAGLVPRGEGRDRDLAWIRAAGRDGVVLFETASQGAS